MTSRKRSPPVGWRRLDILGRRLRPGSSTVFHLDGMKTRFPVLWVTSQWSTFGLATASHHIMCLSCDTPLRQWAFSFCSVYLFDIPWAFSMRSFLQSIHCMQSHSSVTQYFKMSKCIILSFFALCIFSSCSCKPVKYDECSEGMYY